MKKIYFSKMHGLSNDFIIIEAITQNVHLNTEQIKYLSNRHQGIGCDQLLIVEPPYNPTIDFHCRIYNSDGTEVNQCGNGIRCLAQYIYKKKFTKKQIIHISTNTKNMILSIVDNNTISVNMGEPDFDPYKVPFYHSKYKKFYILFLPKEIILCSVLSLGNPHCVIPVESVKKVPVNILGSSLEKHPRFPKKANISFMQMINSNNIKLRVYERNVGETKACGSAACAAVASGIQQGLLKNEQVQVHVPGGILSISWKGIGHPLYMVGTTKYIYEGSIDL